MSRKYFTGVKTMIISSLLVTSSLFAETVIDIVGRQVEVPKKVEKILLGEGRLFHSIAILEGDKPFDRIVGWQGDFKKLDSQNYEVYREKFPEIDNIELIGATTIDTINNEKAIMLKPDIAIFGLSGHGPGKDSPLLKLMEKMNVPVVFVDFRTSPTNNTIPSMKILGKVLDREEKAEKYIQFYNEILDDIKKRVDSIKEEEKTTVFIELKGGTSDDCCLTAGDGNMGSLLDMAGGKNIAKPLLPSVFGNVNLEKLISQNPDIYIISGGNAPDQKANGVKLGARVTKEDAIKSANYLLSRNVIKDLKAVKNHKTHAIWHGYYNSPQNILAIQAFAKWLYPERFKDVDVEKTRAKLHKEFLVIEPTGVFWIDDFHIVK